MATMTVADAMRVADIMEADDVISVVAMACRVLVKYTRDLETQLAEKQTNVDSPLQE